MSGPVDATGGGKTWWRYVRGAGGSSQPLREFLLGCYLVAPLPVCEITPLASLVAFELFVICVGAAVGCIGVAVPLLVVLTQAVSYCEAAPTLLFSCALLYACPPLPPRGLLMPGSLNTEPGDVAALPGVPPPLASVPWQLLPWGLGLAYARRRADDGNSYHAARAKQFGSFLPSVSGRAAQRTPTECTMSTGIWFK